MANSGTAKSYRVALALILKANPFRFYYTLSIRCQIFWQAELHRIHVINCMFARCQRGIQMIDVVSVLYFSRN